ncbi:unnamed protein product [Dracunculus medinensis]|uniref:Ribosome assembly factor mrt4 n=1 Tax=Dracunculus medinensis TaxID=318479 RepID=A0A158Q5R7_DRAME|nr:unnamed protein product [Dracunculus medinensis]
MPRAKREREVSFTKVKKKTKESKRNLVNDIHRCIDSYKNIFIFVVENMRTTNFLKIRQKYKNTSRFFFGKNNLMAVALGRDKDKEYAKDLSKMCPCLKGQCGLMFTNESKFSVIKFFEEFHEMDFTRCSQIATKTIELSEGPLPQFPFSNEYQLRQLGLPTKLEKGVVKLISDYTVCKEGEQLTAEQARLLKYLDIKMATFKITLLGHWSKSDGFNLFN